MIGYVSPSFTDFLTSSVRHSPSVFTFMYSVANKQTKKLGKETHRLGHSVRIYDDFGRLLFLYVHREVPVLTCELPIPEESDQFRFLRATGVVNLKGSVGLTLAKTSGMRISVPLDLSSRSFIPLPCFIRSRCPTPLLTPSLVLFPPCSV
jgi:hypothetical protein